MLSTPLQRFLTLGVALLLLEAGHASAQTVAYTSQSDFEAAIQPGSFVETFDELTANQSIGETLPFSGNGFSFQATATIAEAGNPPDQFYNALNGPSDVWLSTFSSGSLVTFTFTSGNVTAVGGNFFTSDASGNAVTQSLWVTLSDGSSINIPASTPTSFAGFTTTTPIASLSFFPLDSPNFPTANNIIVGESALVAAPEPSVLSEGVLGLVGLMAWGFFRRRDGSKTA